VDSLALANEQLHLESAYERFFDSTKNRYPKYKTRHDSRQSYTTNAVNGNIRIEGEKLRLPKVGKVKIRLHRKAPAEWKLKSVTVSMEASGKYYASILYEIPESENQAVREEKQEKKEINILGIDYAMQGLAVFSDGTRADYPGYYRKGQEKLAREQRKLSHCRKGSRNYEKQRKRVAKCHQKVRNQRNDYQHKLSRRIAERYDAAAVEDIDMKAMSRSLHFGKSVMDNGFGKFREMLAYKLERQGKQLIKIGRFYPSSKRCSCCGQVKKELGLDERTYICACGNRMDRDVNAAINIREEGRRLLCG
jgi:putative transposase